MTVNFRQLEKGELTLDDSLKQFEKGIGLARRCQNVLSQAEQKIVELTTSQYKAENDLDDLSSD